MNNSSPILYALTCDHAAPGPGTLVNGLLYCAWCRTEIQIAGVIEYEWAADCQDCKFKRYAGLSKHNAAVFAHGHIGHNPEHKVDITYTKNPAATATAEKMEKWNGRAKRTTANDRATDR